MSREPPPHLLPNAKVNVNALAGPSGSLIPTYDRLPPVPAPDMYRGESGGGYGALEPEPEAEAYLDMDDGEDDEDNVFRDMGFDEVLEELNARFLVNLPQEEMTLVRVYWQAEQAHWFYEDYLRPLNPHLPSLSQRHFSQLLISSSPIHTTLAASTSGGGGGGEIDYDAVWAAYASYKRMVPCCGGILLNKQGTKALMVRGWKSSAGWCFPRGKININEPEMECAVREVLEETGFDMGAYVREGERDRIKTQINAQEVTMFIAEGVDEGTVFESQTRKEIGAIEWVPLTDLPTWSGRKPKKTDIKGKKFYNVTPFIGPLKRWLVEHGYNVKTRKNQSQAQAQAQAQADLGARGFAQSAYATYAPAEDLGPVRNLQPFFADTAAVVPTATAAAAAVTGRRQPPPPPPRQAARQGKKQRSGAGESSSTSAVASAPHARGASALDQLFDKFVMKQEEELGAVEEYESAGPGGGGGGRGTSADALGGAAQREGLERLFGAQGAGLGVGVGGHSGADGASARAVDGADTEGEGDEDVLARLLGAASVSTAPAPADDRGGGGRGGVVGPQPKDEKAGRLLALLSPRATSGTPRPAAEPPVAPPNVARAGAGARAGQAGPSPSLTAPTQTQASTQTQTQPIKPHHASLLSMLSPQRAPAHPQPHGSAVDTLAAQPVPAGNVAGERETGVLDANGHAETEQDDAERRERGKRLLDSLMGGMGLGDANGDGGVTPNPHQGQSVGYGIVDGSRPGSGGVSVSQQQQGTEARPVHGAPPSHLSGAEGWHATSTAPVPSPKHPLTLGMGSGVGVSAASGPSPIKAFSHGQSAQSRSSAGSSPVKWSGDAHPHPHPYPYSHANANANANANAQVDARGGMGSRESRRSRDGPLVGPGPGRGQDMGSGAGAWVGNDGHAPGSYAVAPAPMMGAPGQGQGLGQAQTGQQQRLLGALQGLGGSGGRERHAPAQPQPQAQAQAQVQVHSQPQPQPHSHPRPPPTTQQQQQHQSHAYAQYVPAPPGGFVAHPPPHTNPLAPPYPHPHPHPGPGRVPSTGYRPAGNGVGGPPGPPFGVPVGPGSGVPFGPGPGPGPGHGGPPAQSHFRPVQARPAASAGGSGLQGPGQGHAPGPALAAGGPQSGAGAGVPFGLSGSGSGSGPGQGQGQGPYAYGAVALSAGGQGARALARYTFAPQPPAQAPAQPYGGPAPYSPGHGPGHGHGHGYGHAHAQGPQFAHALHGSASAVAGGEAGPVPGPVPGPGMVHPVPRQAPGSAGLLAMLNGKGGGGV